MAKVAEIHQFPEPPTVQREDEAVAYEREFLEVLLAHLLPPEYVSVASLGPMVPDQILLGSLRNGRLRVKTPIMVKCRQEDQHVIAEAVEFDEFGFGKNLSEAVSDLQHAIAELYFTLDQEQDRLGPDLQQVWTKLQQAIIRRP